MRSNPIVKAIGIGIVAGMRTFSAPALTSRYLVRQNRHASQSSASNPMASSWLGGILTLAAAGELVADKLPSIPSRISPPLLTGRFLSGAICGASICHAEGERADVGAIIGGLSAIASAYITYYARRKLSEHLPDTVVAVTEDALAVIGGSQILYR